MDDAAIDWSRGGTYYIKSSCGNYTVSRSGAGDGRRFSAWRRHPACQAELLGIYKRAAAAQSRCEKHKSCLNHGTQ